MSFELAVASMFGTVSDARQSSTVYEEILGIFAERYFQVSENDSLSPSSQLIGQEAMLEMLDALKLNESDKSVLQSLINTKPVSEKKCHQFGHHP